MWRMSNCVNHCIAPIASSDSQFWMAHFILFIFFFRLQFLFVRVRLKKGLRGLRQAANSIRFKKQIEQPKTLLQDYRGIYRDKRYIQDLGFVKQKRSNNHFFFVGFCCTVTAMTTLPTIPTNGLELKQIKTKGKAFFGSC